MGRNNQDEFDNMFYEFCQLKKSEKRKDIEETILYLFLDFIYIFLAFIILGLSANQMQVYTGRLNVTFILLVTSISLIIILIDACNFIQNLIENHIGNKVTEKLDYTFFNKYSEKQLNSYLEIAKMEKENCKQNKTRLFIIGIVTGTISSLTTILGMEDFLKNIYCIMMKSNELSKIIFFTILLITYIVLSGFIIWKIVDFLSIIMNYKNYYKEKYLHALMRQLLLANAHK